MRKILIILSLIAVFHSCRSSHGHQEKSIREQEFLLAPNQVGTIEKGMTIKDLYSIFSENQIKKIKTKSELTADASDNFFVYDSLNHLLLIASPQVKNDEGSKITRIVIKDKRYKTEKGIGLQSNVGQIKDAYENTDFLPSANEIVMFVPEIDANFEINPRHLHSNMWNDSTGTIIADSIPANTTVSTLAIFWNPTQNSVTDKAFWHDLTSRFITWLITQVPSILILICLFIGLMRLLHYAVKRIKKVALNRIYRAENIDNDEGQKRINTLSGIIYGVGRIFLWTIFMLIMLGKFNINIAPILASAGIVGLAVGFGAQELVRDFISGFFILLEDQIRTGDVAIINGTTGTVEKIEMRTTTLRDSSGIVHIFQNGKINTLSNMTKGWSAIVVEIGVAYKEDTDYVTEIMKQVGEELQQDPDFGPRMISPVDVWGVDKFGDSSVILKVKITTKSGMQWVVSREYRRRIKKAFDARNIEIPFPHISIYTGDTTKPMPIEIKRPEEKKIEAGHNPATS